MVTVIKGTTGNRLSRAFIYLSVLLLPSPILFLWTVSWRRQREGWHGTREARRLRSSLMDIGSSTIRWQREEEFWSWCGSPWTGEIRKRVEVPDIELVMKTPRANYSNEVDEKNREKGQLNALIEVDFDLFRIVLDWRLWFCWLVAELILHPLLKWLQEVLLLVSQLWIFFSNLGLHSFHLISNEVLDFSIFSVDLWLELCLKDSQSCIILEKDPARFRDDHEKS